MSIFIILVLLIPLVAIVLDSQLGKALASRLERQSLGSGDSGLQERMVYLESEIDRLSTEVGRLEEESQFLHKLLAEKPAPGGLPPGSDSVES